MSQDEDCVNLQSELRTIITVLYRPLFFNSQKFHYIPYESSLSSNSFMSSNYSFEVHINSLCKECTNLIGWILRTFTTRDIITMLTLFKSLVLS